MPGETQYLNIQPAFDTQTVVYDSQRDGYLIKTLAMTPAQAFYNLAMLPAWQKWQPTYRYGTITAINGDKANVTITDDESSQQNIKINQSNTLANVPIEYMQCHEVAFEVGDIVLIKFAAQNFDDPKIIGFKDNPKPCSDTKYLYVTYDNLGILIGMQTNKLGRLKDPDNITKDLEYPFPISKLSAILSVNHLFQMVQAGSAFYYNEDTEDFFDYSNPAALVSTQTNVPGYTDVAGDMEGGIGSLYNNVGNEYFRTATGYRNEPLKSGTAAQFGVFESFRTKNAYNGWSSVVLRDSYMDIDSLQYRDIRSPMYSFNNPQKYVEQKLTIRFEGHTHYEGWSDDRMTTHQASAEVTLTGFFHEFEKYTFTDSNNTSFFYDYIIRNDLERSTSKHLAVLEQIVVRITRKTPYPSNPGILDPDSAVFDYLVLLSLTYKTANEHEIIDVTNIQQLQNGKKISKSTLSAYFKTEISAENIYNSNDVKVFGIYSIIT